MVFLYIAIGGKVMDNTEYLKLNNNNNNEDEIVFNNYSRRYCICIISIVDLTKYLDKLKEPVELRKFYSIFYNTMALIIKNNDGKVIKNVDDGLLFYFPKTVNFLKMSSFQNVLDCGLAMVQACSRINYNLNENRLPSISYKISANYGKVELATSTNSNGVDLFGPTINVCSKINRLALPNQMVIHKDLYDIIEKTSFFKDYVFENISKREVNDKYDDKPLYSVYSVNRIQSKIQNIDRDYEKEVKYLEQKKQNDK